MAITNVVNANVTTPLPVGQGGTSATTLTIHGLLKGDAAGAVSALPAATNGQLPIGSTGADPVLATLTQGSGITITNGAGSITIAASGGGGGITDLEADDTNTASGTTVTVAGDGVNIFTIADNATTLTVSQGPSLVIPATNAALTEGTISQAGNVTLHTYSSGFLPNLFVGTACGNGTNTGIANITTGYQCMSQLTSGQFNVSMGASALQNVEDGSNNVSVGGSSSSLVISGSSNCALGDTALGALLSGSFNTAIGNTSLSNIDTGSNNIALGDHAGTGLVGISSSNICIGNLGDGNESNTIRIGTEGSSAGQQNLCFIAGIANATVTGSPVIIDVTTGQLGVTVSSERFKERITDMAERSDRVMQLRPVNFAYKQDSTHGMQWGLIAEEVADVMPELVTYDMLGAPYTVRYNDLPAILLNELQKLHKRVAELEAKCKE